MLSLRMVWSRRERPPNWFAIGVEGLVTCYRCYCGYVVTD